MHAEGWVQIGDERVVLERPTTSFFRNHSWGYQPPRGRPAAHGTPVPASGRPVCGNGCSSTRPSTAGSSSRTPAGGSPRRGAVLQGDRVIPIVDVATELEFYEGGRRVRRGWFRLTDVEATIREYEFESLGWVYCQGGGYFGGFDDGLGQGIYRGDQHVEGEIWDVSHPTTFDRGLGPIIRSRTRLGRELYAAPA